MKRPEAKLNCLGSLKPHLRHIPDGGGFGVCGTSQQQTTFTRIAGKSVPVEHPPKKARRSTGLPTPRGGERQPERRE